MKQYKRVTKRAPRRIYWIKESETKFKCKLFDHCKKTESFYLTNDEKKNKRLMFNAKRNITRHYEREHMNVIKSGRINRPGTFTKTIKVKDSNGNLIERVICVKCNQKDPNPIFYNVPPNLTKDERHKKMQSFKGIIMHHIRRDHQPNPSLKSKSRVKKVPKYTYKSKTNKNLVKCDECSYSINLKKTGIIQNNATQNVKIHKVVKHHSLIYGHCKWCSLKYRRSCSEKIHLFGCVKECNRFKQIMNIREDNAFKVKEEETKKELNFTEGTNAKGSKIYRYPGSERRHTKPIDEEGRCSNLRKYLGIKTK